MKKNNGKIKNPIIQTKKSKETILVTVTAISMVIYILWRCIFTIPDHQTYGWLAFICGILLALSEAIGMMEAVEHYINLQTDVEPEMPEIPLSWYPDVDILIATHNEDVELLYKTVNGCKHMCYPDPDKVHIYICDDMARPAMEQLARDMGVGYFGLKNNKFAKAGNLNNALAQSSSPYIVTFDADMIPTHKFLMETVPYMFLPRMKKNEDGQWVERSPEELDENEKIGFIQTPQSFYNPDLFQFNFYSEGRIPNEQDFFFREVNVGRNRANASIYAGSNTLISRQALEEVGGIATGTITEDFETGIRIQARGYRCYAVNKVLAHGLSPTEVPSLIKQRVRWGRGCVYSLRKVNILFNRHLPLSTKISYLSSWMYWWTFFRRFVYILAPVLFILFGIPSVICTLPELLLIWLPSYILYNHTLKVTSRKIRTQRWSNIVDTIIFPYLMIPILLETLGIKEKKFHVTSKSRSLDRSDDLLYAIPHVILLLLDVAALAVALWQALTYHNAGGIILIYWLLINGANLCMAVFFMSGRQNLRNADRFQVRLPARLRVQEVDYYGETGDISETGLSVFLEKPVYVPQDQFFELELNSGLYSAVLQGKVMHVVQVGNRWKYGILLGELDEKNKAEYFQIVYDRDHTMAQSVDASVTVAEDIFINIHKRLERTYPSMRKLPRIVLNETCKTRQGIQVKLVDLNYEYAMVRPVEGELPDELDIYVRSDLTLHCHRDPKREGLYCILNRQELLFTGAFERLMKSTAQYV